MTINKFFKLLGSTLKKVPMVLICALLLTESTRTYLRTSWFHIKMSLLFTHVVTSVFVSSVKC